MVLQSPLKVQVLVSALNKDINTLPQQMNIETDAVIVNQCECYDYREFLPDWLLDDKKKSGADASCTDTTAKKIQCFCMKERGVGLSRNTALLHADADICLFRMRI